MKILVILLSAALMLALSYCNFPKEIAKTGNEVLRFKTTYSGNVSITISSYCSPCHIPAKGGFKKDYSNYTNVKTDIDEIIRRIELNPGDKGFMPFKRTKVSDSVVNVFKQWKVDGLLEN